LTPARFALLQQVLDRRQPDLTVLMDNVHKPHNFSAILRTCDAVGVLEAHGVWPDPMLQPHRDISAGVGKWVRVRTHRTLRAAADWLRRREFRLVAAHLSDAARDYREIDWTVPSAVLLGAELRGVSAEGAGLADEHAAIPMAGFGPSLNVSVAAAVILFEAQRQRAHAGPGARSRLAPGERARTLFEWAHPELARRCREHGLAYPDLDARGDPVGPLPEAVRPRAR